MNTTVESTLANEMATDRIENGDALQLVTFRIGDVLMGIDIAHVQEINRLLDVTPVPQASDQIHGVVNLRGEVVTVLNAHKIFSIDCEHGLGSRRNLILNLDGERLGILVDGVSDILTIRQRELVSRPSNTPPIDRRFIKSVCLRDEGIIIVIDPAGLTASIDA